MFRKEKGKSNKKNRVRGLLFFMLMVFLVTGATPVQAAGKDPQAVSVAKKHRVTKGKWVKNKNGYRYKKKDGTYVKNSWNYISGYVYWFDEQGYVKTGSFKYQGCSYYADTHGKLYINKMRKKGTRTYFYGSTGAMVKAGWKSYHGKMYYFNRTGEMVKNSWVANSYVGRDGARVASQTVQGRKIDKNGVLQKISKDDKTIIVGASRVVDMSVAVKGKNTVFIAKGGQGYTWLKNTASKQLTSYLKKYPKCKVVFQLGNNDLGNISSYIKFYNSLMKKYPKTKFYFMDALPGESKKGKKNARREAFNKKMKDAFGTKYIGGYDYILSSEGFATLDGVHYPAAVSDRLYRYILRKIK